MSEMVENPTLELDDLDDVAISVAGQPSTGLVSFGFAKRAGVLLERQEHSERHLLYRKPLNWTAFAEGEGKNLACMAVSKPKKAEGNYSRRGDIFAIVTHLPGQNKWNEFSIVAGYNFQPNSNPDVTIGDMKFQLFTSGSRAWSFSPSEDDKIVKFLKNSMKMKVVGTSSRGTITNDTYSLK